MAWRIPQSQTADVGNVINLGATDSVFVASGVTIAALSNSTIVGNGSNHEVLIYGTVACDFAISAISLGDNAGIDTGEIVTIKAGGQVRALESAGIRCLATGSQITNEGLLVADTDGIFVAAANITNSGTIEAGNSAINRGGPGTAFGTMLLTNSGLISGARAYDGSDSIDSIINTGRMVGLIQLAGGEDEVTNSGVITGDVKLGLGNDSFTNIGGGTSGTVFGEGGNDTLIGGSSADTFDGGVGIDLLRGGGGKDLLTGGGDADTFDFNSIQESKLGASRDVILDFSGVNGGELDLIDLSDIDAKKGGGNQAFKFVATKFHKVAGELLVKFDATNHVALVSGDIDGNGKADFQIEVHSLTALVKGDFIL